MKIEMEKLNMIYPGRKQALQDVYLTLESPSLVGLLGPNGAGKSTLMKLLTAGLLPTQGEIRVDGQPLVKCEKRLKSGLGYLPQSFGLYDELTVYQFLDYMAALKGIQNSRQSIAKAIASVHLKAKQEAKIRTLSGGQRQRVGIAQAILGQPEFLVLDEPTVGLDPEERVNFRNMFSEMARERLDIQQVCNRLIIIGQGRILFDGTAKRLISETKTSNLETAYLHLISKEDGR